MRQGTRPIGDVYQQHFPLVVERYSNREVAGVFRVANRVVHDIRQHQIDRRSINVHGGQIEGNLEVPLEIALCELWPEMLEAFCDYQSDVDRLAAIDLRHIGHSCVGEEIVDKPCESSDFANGQSRVVAGHLNRSDAVGCQHVHQRADTGNRCLELVSDGRDEVTAQLDKLRARAHRAQGDAQRHDQRERGDGTHGKSLSRSSLRGTKSGRFGGHCDCGPGVSARRQRARSNDARRDEQQRERAPAHRRPRIEHGPGDALFAFIQNRERHIASQIRGPGNLGHDIRDVIGSDPVEIDHESDDRARPLTKDVLVCHGRDDLIRATIAQREIEDRKLLAGFSVLLHPVENLATDGRIVTDGHGKRLFGGPVFFQPGRPAIAPSVEGQLILQGALDKKDFGIRVPGKGTHDDLQVEGAWSGLARARERKKDVRLNRAHVAREGREQQINGDFGRCPGNQRRTLFPVRRAAIGEPDQRPD